MLIPNSRRPSARPPIANYGVVVFLVAMATICLVLVETHHFRDPPYVGLLLLTVVIGTWFCGRWPGLIAVALSVLAFVYFALHSSLAVPAEVPRIVLYSALATVVWWVFAAERSAREHLAHALDQVTRSNEALRAENASRRKAEEQLRVSEAKFRALSENAPAAIAIIQGDKFCYVNPMTEAITGYSRQELLEMNDGDAAGPESGDPGRTLGWALLRGESVRPRHEVKTVTKAGEERWLDVTGSEFELEGRPAVAGIAFDITERKRMERDLEKEREILQKIFDYAPAMLSLFDQNGHPVMVNREWERVTGWSLAQVTELKLDLLAETHPDPGEHERARKFFAAATGEWSDFRLRTKDGRMIDVACAWVRLSDGTTINIKKDVTERKRAEEALRATTEQLRALTSRLQSIREEEERRIGRELHDEIGSALTGLKWDSEGLGKLCSEAGGRIDCSELRSRSSDMVGRIEAALQAVRAISADLCPAILEDLGLIKGLEWLTQQFTLRTGIVCRFDSSVQFVDFDRQKATAVYRIIQEALTNVLRHSQASRVGISVQQENGDLLFEVRDNGRGITESERSSAKSLGLLGMLERARVAMGSVSIVGSPGKGTTLTVRVPAAFMVPA